LSLEPLVGATTLALVYTLFLLLALFCYYKKRKKVVYGVGVFLCPEVYLFLLWPSFFSFLWLVPLYLVRILFASSVKRRIHLNTLTRPHFVRMLGFFPDSFYFVLFYTTLFSSFFAFVYLGVYPYLNDSWVFLFQVLMYSGCLYSVLSKPAENLSWQKEIS